MKPFLAWISLLCACSGPVADHPDAGSEPDADGPPLDLVVVAPADGATDVATEAVVTLRFDRAVDPATFGVTLIDDLGVTVEGTATADAEVGTFTPAAALRAERTYTATVTTDVTDLDGRALDAETSWSFATRSRAWTEAALIEGEAGPIQDPELAVDAAGNVLAVWIQSDGTTERVVANRFVAGDGWSAPAPLDAEAEAWARDARVACDPAGNAIAIWRHRPATGVDTIRTSRFVPGSGWSAAEVLEPGEAPQIAFTPDGNAIATWASTTGSVESIRASRYLAGVGWEAPVLLETDDTGGASNPQLAIDAHGDAIAVWMQQVDPRWSVFANRYTAGVGWSGAELVELDDTTDAGDPQIALDAVGDAVVVWAIYDGGVAASRYTPDAGWGPMVTLDAAGSTPLVAVARTGEAIATWSRGDGTGARSRWFDPADGWAATEVLAPTGHAAGVAFDAAGRAVVVLTATTGVSARRFAPATGWSAPAVLGAGTGSVPRLAVNPDGDAAVVWGEVVETRTDLWASLLR